ncbi:YqhR family membrane protein [Salimicrobium halophilum]|uniref:Conserved membrane protein YqhR n=1 Tax=Salimicrobium halophilum TaxID=86666 RepID=A0A1G8PTY3_9BACI|nr:YqhR family membrane protein [Salimicrobium halophilum]SDI95957.1 Conserved membrane protein YqhR [Salimicrobium halophilum]
MNERKENGMLGKVTAIGAVAGLFLAFSWMGSSYFSFTKLSMTDLLNRPFIFGDVDDVLFLKVTNVLIIITISLFLAFLYYVLLKKYQGLLPGVGVGVLCFGVVILLGVYIVPDFSWDSDSLVSLFCLFLLYGVFLGYSISFNWAEEEQKRRE